MSVMPDSRQRMKKDSKLSDVTQVCSRWSGSGTHISLSSHEASGQAAFRYSHLHTNKFPLEVIWTEWLPLLSGQSNDRLSRIVVNFASSVTSSNIVVYSGVWIVFRRGVRFVVDVDVDVVVVVYSLLFFT